MYCFCFLAYGDEHIDEFNIVAKSLLKLNPEYKIIVGTDSEDKIIDGVYKIIKMDEPFNYNLKRIVIKEAFVDFNTLIFLDTDIFIRNGIDFSVLDNLEPCIYADEIVDMEQLKDVYGSLEYMKEYLDTLRSIYSDDLYLIHEGLFVLNIDDINVKNEFIENWKTIDTQTRVHQKLAYNLPGAMEGLIIWIALKKSNIHIKLADGVLRKMFNLIAHFGSRNRKMEKTLI